MKASRTILLFLPALWTGVGFMIYGGATNNGDMIGIGVLIFVVSLISALALKASKSSAAHRKRGELWRSGTAAKAKILDIRTKGGGLNDNPLIQFHLQVSAPDQDPYDVHTEFIVSKIRLPAIQPGEEIDIRIDPADPQRIAPDASLVYPEYPDSAP